MYDSEFLVKLKCHRDVRSDCGQLVIVSFYRGILDLVEHKTRYTLFFEHMQTIIPENSGESDVCLFNTGFISHRQLDVTCKLGH